MKAIGVYIFAGGFTLGVKRAGFDVLAQLEDGPYGVATTLRNHPGMPVHASPATWPLDALRAAGPIDFVFGNPPCAPFSNAGISHKKVGMMNDHWKRDPRTSCITKMFGVLERVEPTVWAWESVQPALRRGREMVDELTAVARSHGYAATYVLLNAVDIGVPQIRRRFFCVFHRVAIDWEYTRVPKRTVRDAWAPILEGGVVDASPTPPSPTKNPEHLRLLREIPPGGSLRKAWERAHPPETWEKNAHGTIRGRPRFLDVRLDYDEPSPTLTGGATKFHPVEDRYITLLEQQLLCGYPPEYVFEGPNLSNKYAQTAQAVMPPVGEWLARNVRRAIERGAPVDPSTVTTADLAHGHTIVTGRKTASQDEADTTIAVPSIPTTGPTYPGTEPMSKSEDSPNFRAFSDGGSGAGAPKQHNPDRDPSTTRKEKNDTPVLQANTLTEKADGELLRIGYAGPTALARALITQGATDDAIMVATRNAFGPGSPRPLKFTRTDLQRLRARVVRTAAA